MRRRASRGSPANGLRSGVHTSQNTRATPLWSGATAESGRSKHRETPACRLPRAWQSPRWRSRQSQYPPQKRPRVLGAMAKFLRQAENVDKPQTHKADVTLLYGAEYVIDVLLVHVAPLSFRGGFRLVYIADTIAEKCFRRVKAYQALKKRARTGRCERAG